jgi:plastocyanin
MTRLKSLKLGAAALAAGAVVLVPAAAGAGAASTKKVSIGDNFYSPSKLTIHKGTTVAWQWPTTTGDTHDVTLDKGPKGVKKFQSEIAASDYTYKKKFTVAGKYHIICSLHEDMTMDITVR